MFLSTYKLTTNCYIHQSSSSKNFLLWMAYILFFLFTCLIYLFQPHHIKCSIYRFSLGASCMRNAVGCFYFFWEILLWQVGLPFHVFEFLSFCFLITMVSLYVYASPFWITFCFFSHIFLSFTTFQELEPVS